MIQAGAEYIQIDEPILVTDYSESYEDITKEAYEYFAQAGLGEKLVIQTYFERAFKILKFITSWRIRFDFVHDNGYNLKQIEAGDFDSSKSLYAGIIDGRNCGLQILKLKAIN